MRAIAISASIIAILALFAAGYFFRQSYERVQWPQPTTLVRETASRPGLEGSWTGTFYHPNDCPGCETLERVRLDIRADSTARLAFAIDTLDLIVVPFTNLTYARPSLYRVRADEARIQPGRLVMTGDTSATVPFELRGDSLLFDGLDSRVSSF